jgi:hypothetical protein
MPGGDRTGPLGKGPMTGRRFGHRGGFGRGRGKGFGRQAAVPFYADEAPFPQQNEAEMLRQEAQQLEAALEEIKKRLAQLEE